MRRLGRGTEMMIAGLVVLAAAFAYWFGPWLRDDRGIVAATPAGFPLTEGEVAVGEGERACLEPIGITPRDQVAVFAATSASGGRVPVRVTLSGPGYSASAVAREYEDGKPVAVPIRPPGRDLIGRACFAGVGGAIELVASTEMRAASLLSQTLVDGNAVPQDVSLRFDQAGTTSMLDHMDDGFDRLGLWKPGIVGSALLWLLVALVVLAVPALTLWAYAGSVGRRDDDDDDQPARSASA